MESNNTSHFILILEFFYLVRGIPQAMSLRFGITDALPRG